LLLAPTPLLCFGFGCLIVGSAADPASRAVLANAPLDAGSVAEVKHEVFIVPVFAPRAGVLPSAGRDPRLPMLGRCELSAWDFGAVSIARGINQGIECQVFQRATLGTGTRPGVSSWLARPGTTTTLRHRARPGDHRLRTSADRRSARTAADMGAPVPRIDVADELLDEWIIACPAGPSEAVPGARCPSNNLDV
jgi:hypothetical protein